VKIYAPTKPCMQMFMFPQFYSSLAKTRRHANVHQQMTR
jgi:hypothetical protein